MKKRIALILLSLFFPGIILAALAPTCPDYCANPSAYDGPPTNQVCICNPLSSTDFEVIIERLIDWIFGIALVLAPLMIAIGAFLFVTSGGVPEKITRAKNLMIWTTVGFIILLLSKGILDIIKELLGVR